MFGNRSVGRHALPWIEYLPVGQKADSTQINPVDRHLGVDLRSIERLWLFLSRVLILILTQRYSLPSGIVRVSSRSHDPSRYFRHIGKKTLGGKPEYAKLCIASFPIGSLSHFSAPMHTIQTHSGQCSVLPSRIQCMLHTENPLDSADLPKKEPA